MAVASEAVARELLRRIPAMVRDTVRAEGVCRVVYCHVRDEDDDGGRADGSNSGGSSSSDATPPFDVVAHDAFAAADVAAPAAGAADDWALVYDVMRVRDTRILFAADHLRRIADSYRAVARGRELSAAARAHVAAALTRYTADTRARDGVGAAEQNVKFVAWLPAAATATATTTTAAPHAVPFVVFFMRTFYPPEAWYATGTTLALLYDAARSNPNAKVVQGALRARAAALQRSLDVYEVLLVHTEADGYVIPEGSRSNYLLVMPDKTVLCSPCEDILVGVTLQSTLRALAAAGLGAVQHRRLTLRDVCACTSLVMLGTSVGVLPVRQLVLSYDEASERALLRMATVCLGTRPQRVTDVPRARTLAPPSADGPPSPARTVIEFDVHDAFLQQLRRAYETAALA